MRPRTIRLLGGLGVLVLVFLLGYAAIRPVHLRWGAGDEDLARAMPGDLGGARWTRAIAIAATPEQIWPWLVQFGQGRGGWYSYDWLENLFGFDIHTADRILPEHQRPQIGTPICMAAGFCPSQVSVIAPNRWFGWQARDELGRPIWTFVFGLVPLDAGHTRLVVRESFDPAAMPVAATILLEIPDVVMEQKMLHTLRLRAEGRGEPPLTAAYEIVVWLAACAVCLAALGLYAGRGRRRDLALSAVALLALLALTFLFPPLWLRGAIAVTLLVGAGWGLRQAGRPSMPAVARA